MRLPNFGEAAFCWCAFSQSLNFTNEESIKFVLLKVIFINGLKLFGQAFFMNHKWASTLRYPVQKENTDRKNE
jgi:hypothetical protein|tara:strand:- start:118 stop:336 length:219 start_codon:yes stop_codon:yes gene_type:complete